MNQTPEGIISRAKKFESHNSKIIFWSALMVAIFGNIIVSLILIPFMIVLTPTLLYITIGLLSASLGFLYNLLITDIGHLEKKHHISAGIILPLLAIGNMLVVVLIANQFIADLQVANEPHNPLILGTVFAVFFILPYVLSRLFEKKVINKI